MDFSPTRKDNANKENDASVLSLVLFSKAPFVTFGTVKLGTSKSAVLRIENPTEDAEAEVAVDKVPTGKGFSVDCNTFTVQVNSQNEFANVSVKNVKCIMWETGSTTTLLQFTVLNVNRTDPVLILCSVILN